MDIYTAFETLDSIKESVRQQQWDVALEDARELVGFLEKKVEDMPPEDKRYSPPSA